MGLDFVCCLNVSLQDEKGNKKRFYCYYGKSSFFFRLRAIHLDQNKDRKEVRDFCWGLAM